jgi:hypothetical protein
MEVAHIELSLAEVKRNPVLMDRKQVSVSRLMRPPNRASLHVVGESGAVVIDTGGFGRPGVLLHVVGDSRRVGKPAWR